MSISSGSMEGCMTLPVFQVYFLGIREYQSKQFMPSIGLVNTVFGYLRTRFARRLSFATKTPGRCLFCKASFKAQHRSVQSTETHLFTLAKTLKHGLQHLFAHKIGIFHEQTTHMLTASQCSAVVPSFAGKAGHAPYSSNFSMQRFCLSINAMASIAMSSKSVCPRQMWDKIGGLYRNKSFQYPTQCRPTLFSTIGSGIIIPRLHDEAHLISYVLSYAF